MSKYVDLHLTNNEAVALQSAIEDALYAYDQRLADVIEGVDDCDAAQWKKDIAAIERVGKKLIAALNNDGGGA